jgi:hypothetical protein
VSAEILGAELEPLSPHAGAGASFGGGGGGAENMANNFVKKV